jgi:hypothetical protein
VDKMQADKFKDYGAPPASDRFSGMGGIGSPLDGPPGATGAGALVKKPAIIALALVIVLVVAYMTLSSSSSTPTATPARKGPIKTK